MPCHDNVNRPRRRAPDMSACCGRLGKQSALHLGGRALACRVVESAVDQRAEPWPLDAGASARAGIGLEGGVPFARFPTCDRHLRAHQTVPAVAGTRSTFRRGIHRRPRTCQAKSVVSLLCPSREPTDVRSAPQTVRTGRLGQRPQPLLHSCRGSRPSKVLIVRTGR
jgi:hypothetical protein